jgi:hypothetical protein
MTIAFALDALRGRFMRLRGNVPYEQLAAPTGLSPATLKSFVYGHQITTRTAMAIEQWCDRTEAALVPAERTPV